MLQAEVNAGVKGSILEVVEEVGFHHKELQVKLKVRLLFALIHYLHGRSEDIELQAFEPDVELDALEEVAKGIG